MVQRRSGERGQSTVELALLLPVVLMLLLALLQVALVARDLVLVTHATREAARAAAVGEDPDAAAERSAGLRSERLRVDVDGAAGSGSRAQVRVSYRSPTNVPLVGGLLPDITISGSARARVE